MIIVIYSYKNLTITSVDIAPMLGVLPCNLLDTPLNTGLFPSLFSSLVDIKLCPLQILSIR